METNTPNRPPKAAEVFRVAKNPEMRTQHGQELQNRRLTRQSIPLLLATAYGSEDSSISGYALIVRSVRLHNFCDIGILT